MNDRNAMREDGPSGGNIELLSDAARALDEELVRLDEARLSLIAKLGQDQIEHLQALFNQRLGRYEQIELRSSMGYWERKLLWIWARQARLQTLRQEIGHNAMKFIKLGKEHD